MKHTRIIILAAALAAAAPGWAADRQLVSVDTARPRAVTTMLHISDPAAQPVRLAGLKVESRVVGGLARSTVELTFHNPNARILEGELQFPLLEGQQVTGFALDFDGKWRGAVPVEKAKGQQVFEEVTRARVDPALLEETQGNNFKLRIYPIPANGERKVSLTITERLAVGSDGKGILRLPLMAAERIDDFAFHLAAPGLEPAQARVLRGLAGAAWQRDEEGLRLDVSRRDYRPEALLEIALERPARPVVVVEEMDGKQYFYAESPMPRFDPALRPVPARLALVWDASGSGARRDHGREFALLDAYFKTIGETRVNLVLARDRAETGGSFRVRGGDWSALRAALEQVAYDGATNPGAFRPTQAADAVLLFSDGLANFGATAMPHFDAPLLAVSASVTADLARLRHAAAGSGGMLVDLMHTAPDKAAQLLRAAPPRIVALRSNGARQLVASPVEGDGRVAIAGVLSEAQTSIEVEWLTPSGGRDKQTLKVAQGHAVSGFAARQWARMRIDTLEPEYALNKAEVQRLGKAFGLVTRATSLIVLDRVEDYVRYDILPPAELRAEFDRLRGSERQAAARDKAAHLDEIVHRFKEKQAWWERDFPKDAAATPKRKEKLAVAESLARPEEWVADRVRRERPDAAASPAPAAAPRAEMEMAKTAGPRANSMPAARPVMAAEPAAAAPTASIKLKKWTPDAPYAERLRKADRANLYRVYLDERPGYLDSTAFFLDAADIFFDRGEPQLALRILSNLAEMDLENRHILRILGYRLLQAKRADLAVPMLERVLELAPEEPQSYRDLGLAQAQSGQRQKAVELLYEVVTRPWHGRFPDIELIALAELNAIVASAPGKLDISAIDPRLLRNLPLDLRTVLSWDADNTDIDLWVTDPNGEKVYFGHTLSRQGGRISRDFTGGYGPEEFSIKTAKPGKYLVQAQFYGHRQQVVSGATTLQLHLFTGFGTTHQHDQSVTLRLKSGGELVTVGEFVVGGKSGTE